MCGICGEFKFNGKSFNDVKLTNLMSSISNRGRDSKGTFKNTDIFLGHHRLSIIDTSDKSNQPMVIENYVIVFNGIIYNYIFYYWFTRWNCIFSFMFTKEKYNIEGYLKKYSFIY